MGQAVFRFYAELNDLLPRQRRHIAFVHHFAGRASVKDMIEALGVPHPEIDLILLNGESVDYSAIVQAGDRIGVYPRFRSIDITPVVRVRPEPLRTPRFVADNHLGRLAAYLRMLGFDTLYEIDLEDSRLANLSDSQGRILLTRDVNLLKRGVVEHGAYVRETIPRAQLREVLERYDLWPSIEPYRYCIRCNGNIVEVAKESVLDRLPPGTQSYFDEFRQCQRCQRVYWKGSHYDRMQAFIGELHKETPGPRGYRLSLQVSRRPQNCA